MMYSILDAMYYVCMYICYAKDIFGFNQMVLLSYTC